MENRVSYKQKKRISDIQIILTFSISVSLLVAIPLTPEEGDSISGKFSKMAFSIAKGKEQIITSVQSHLRQNQFLSMEEAPDQ